MTADVRLISHSAWEGADFEVPRDSFERIDGGAGDNIVIQD